MGFLSRFFISLLICFGGLAAIVHFSTLGLDGEGEPAAEPVAAEAPAPADPPRAPQGSLGHPANADLRINNAGLAIIKASEGLRLEAYELMGRWYIGYGHQCTGCAGSRITEAEADALLRDDVTVAESAVRRLVTVQVNANEFSAMVSLAYNLGGGNFAKSMVVSYLNASDRKAAADAFRNHNRAGNQVIQHLVERREKERALFLSQ